MNLSFGHVFWGQEGKFMKVKSLFSGSVVIISSFPGTFNQVISSLHRPRKYPMLDLSCE